MADHPGRIPGAEELGLRAAAQRLVGEYFARLDRADVEGVLELYAEDAALEDVKGKNAIRQSILDSSGAVAGKTVPHLPVNIRAAVVDDSVVVDYTVIVYSLDGPGPYPAVAIINQRQIHRRTAPDGSLRIVDHRVQGYDFGQGSEGGDPQRMARAGSRYDTTETITGRLFTSLSCRT
jgi:hypothetical protein